jgi:hypothetical protein
MTKKWKKQAKFIISEIWKIEHVGLLQTLTEEYHDKFNFE